MTSYWSKSRWNWRKLPAQTLCFPSHNLLSYNDLSCLPLVLGEISLHWACRMQRHYFLGFFHICWVIPQETYDLHWASKSLAVLVQVRFSGSPRDPSGPCRRRLTLTSSSAWWRIASPNRRPATSMTLALACSALRLDRTSKQTWEFGWFRWWWLCRVNTRSFEI